MPSNQNQSNDLLSINHRDEFNKSADKLIQVPVLCAQYYSFLLKKYVELSYEGIYTQLKEASNPKDNNNTKTNDVPHPFCDALARILVYIAVKKLISMHFKLLFKQENPLFLSSLIAGHLMSDICNNPKDEFKKTGFFEVLTAFVFLSVIESQLPSKLNFPLVILASTIFMAFYQDAQRNKKSEVAGVSQGNSNPHLTKIEENKKGIKINIGSFARFNFSM